MCPRRKGPENGKITKTEIFSNFQACPNIEQILRLDILLELFGGGVILFTKVLCIHW